MQNISKTLRFQRPLIQSSRNCSTPGLSPSRRFFHSSQKFQSSFVDDCCSQAFEIINTVHSSTGLSWVYALPVTAFLLRTTLFTPWTIWARINTQRLAEMRPLALAWVPVIRKRILKENVQLGPVACQKLADMALREKQAELRKKFGIYRSAAFAPLLQLPIFLLAIETIRRMSGVESGLLGWAAQVFTGQEEVSNSLAQPSLASEGALWFPNLLVPDPHLILPLALSALLFANVSYQETITKRMGIRESRRGLIINRTLKILSLAIFPATLNLPAAIHIYWISSAVSATVTNGALEVLMPVRSSPNPCEPGIKSYLRDLTGKTEPRP